MQQLNQPPPSSLGTVVRSNLIASLSSARSWMRAHPTAVTVIGSLTVAAALAIALASKRHDFAAALGAAPLWILGLAVVLHLIWLVARSEAWHVCVGAAGGSVGRRRLYRAASSV